MGFKLASRELAYFTDVVTSTIDIREKEKIWRGDFIDQMIDSTGM